MNRLDNQIFDSLNTGLVFLDKDLKLVQYNRRGLSALGADDTLDLTGTNIFEVSDQCTDDFREIFQSVLDEQHYKNVWSYPIKCNNQEQSCFWDYTISNFDDGILLTATDASERVSKETKTLKEAEAEIARLEEKVKEYNHLKADFIANISHELRTPLTSIIGFAQIMKSAIERGQTPTPNVSQGLEKILRNARHLLEMVEDVLTLTKLESGHLRFTYEKFKLPSLVREAVSSLETSAASKDLTLQLEIADSEFPTANSDARWVYQIIRSLISNAVKFTQFGSILVNLQNLDDAEWKISIADTGIGIEDKNLKRIFENFHQADMSITRESGGFGLGLSLAKMLSEKLGGSISLTSEFGKGSIFTLQMPFNSPIENAVEKDSRH